MTHQEAAVYVHQKMTENVPLNTLCADIIAEALKRGSTDNVTAIVVRVDWV